MEIVNALLIIAPTVLSCAFGMFLQFKVKLDAPSIYWLLGGAGVFLSMSIAFLLGVI